MSSALERGVFRGTFAGLVQAEDHAFGLCVVQRREAIARRQFPTTDLVYMEQLPVVGTWTYALASGDQTSEVSPFESVGVVERGHKNSVGCYHYAWGHLFRSSADVTRYVMDEIVAKNEKPWLWEAKFLLAKVHVFVWNRFSREELHWCCDLRKGTVNEIVVTLPQRGTRGTSGSRPPDAAFWDEVFLSQMIAWGMRYDLPHDEMAPPILVHRGQVTASHINAAIAMKSVHVAEYSTSLLRCFLKLGLWQEAHTWIETMMGESSCKSLLQVMLFMDLGNRQKALRVAALAPMRPLNCDLVMLKCRCILESNRLEKCQDVRKVAHLDAMAWSGALVSGLRDVRREARQHSPEERIANKSLHDGLLVHAMTIAAGGQLDIALQVLTEALTLYDEALPPMAEDLLIPPTHLKFRVPWQRGCSLGAEMTDFVGRRDPLATFATVELDLGKSIYLSGKQASKQLALVPIGQVVLLNFFFF
jgi:hypothetical protein